jgi:23S rRNA (uracil1939-C5)-methyltransferase
MSGARGLRITQPLYGGRFATDDARVTLPFVLPGELVEVSAADEIGRDVERIVEPSQHRVAPRCPHFGSCGGCHYQMASYAEQLAIKQRILRSLLAASAIDVPEPIEVVSAEPYAYRNRIRLRMERIDGVLRMGYSAFGTAAFLPITQCPIAAPVLWKCAESLLHAASAHADAAFWMNAAREVELFADNDLTRVQVTLLCAPRTRGDAGSLARFLAALQMQQPAINGIRAIALDPRTGPTGRTLAQAGAAGLSYRVLDECYWVSAGGFFQINRFLLGELVPLVCSVEGKPRSGRVAWDLYAGVGLFSRVLARSFQRVVAVEANAIAAADNHAALRKIATTHEAVAATTLAFLERALVQRERPELILLDPPRAGAGIEACELLLKLAPAQMVYVSCDPTTLARDLKVLTQEYTIQSMHMVDLFPQTFHLETVVTLERRK